eukprot:Gb_36726 [translate_table: standard]
MSFDLFQSLLSEIQLFLPSTNRMEFVKEPIHPEKALSCVLHRLAHGTSSHVIAELYCMGESTVRKYTEIIIYIIIQTMQKRYIKIPSRDQLHKIMSDFQTITLLPTICGVIDGTHMRTRCGVIDGTHIKLTKKAKNDDTPVQYMNRHHFYSVLLGICDAQKVFWDVCVNAPGGTNDARHWNCSAIRYKMQTRQVLASPTIQIEGVTIYPHLIGDSAYPLSHSMLKPYKLNNLELQINFDKHLAKS